MRLFFTVLSIVLLATGSWAKEPESLQVTLGGSNASDLAVGLAAFWGRGRSVYVDYLRSPGYGGGSTAARAISESGEFDTAFAVGLAVQKRQGSLYTGAGIESYTRKYRYGSSRVKLGGKLLLGAAIGRRLIFEAAWHYVGNTRDSRATFGLGARFW